MKLSRLLIVVLFTVSVFFIKTVSATEAYSLQYDPKRDPFVDGRAAIALAAETNRRVLIVVGGDWCKWCHALDRFISSDLQIEKELYKTFVVLKVNVNDENSNENFLASFPKIVGYPQMYITESNGKVIHSQDAAEFLINLKYSKNKFITFLKRWRLSPVEGVTKK